MGVAFGKASGRTFHPMSPHFPDTPSSSLWVASSRSLKMSNQPPSEALKGGLLMSIFATCGITLPLRQSPCTVNDPAGRMGKSFMGPASHRERVGLKVTGPHPMDRPGVKNPNDPLEQASEVSLPVQQR